MRIFIARAETIGGKILLNFCTNLTRQNTTLMTTIATAMTKTATTLLLRSCFVVNITVCEIQKDGLYQPAFWI